MPRVPLTLPFQHKASEQTINATQDASITTLPNGLRVVSRDQPGGASVGLFIDSGSRHDAVPGTTQLLESMLLRSTENRSAFRLSRDLSKLGVTLTARADREHIQVTTDALREHVPYVVNALADIVQNPLLDEHEIAETSAHAAAQSEERVKTPDNVVMDELHRVAFGGKTLGNPLYAAPSQAGSLNKEDLANYIASQFEPARLVIAAVGVDHAELVRLTEAAFRNAGAAGAGSASEAATYTGGDSRITSLEGGRANLAIAFPAPNWLSKDLVGMCVLQVLMGGGGSFSAGGPGKGMCSRIYETVLNQYYFVQSANCFNSIFSDAALFGLHGSCEAEHLDKLADVLVSSLKNMAGPLRPGELERARNALKSNLAMQLEQRPYMLEDIGRQLLTYKKVQTVDEVFDLIDKVTEGDIQRIARQMMSNPVTVSAYGDLSRLPSQQQIASQFKF